MPVPTQLSDLNATAASNSPAATDTINTTDDYLRAHASILARISAGTDALVSPSITTANVTSLNVSGDVILTGAGKGITFEGTTADANETLLVAGEPSADRTITLPDATTTLVGTDATQTLTNKTLTSPTIQGTVAAGTGLTLPALTLSGNVGSSGNPSLNIGTGALTAGAASFSSETNSGNLTFTGTGSLIQAPSNPMTFTVGGSERLRIDTSGNVGINAPNPTTMLQLGDLGAGDSTNQGRLKLEDAASSIDQTGGVEFKASTFGSGYGWKLNAIDSSGVHLVFGTRQNSATWSEKGRIASDGTTTLGGTSTAPAFKVNAAGSSVNYLQISAGGTGNAEAPILEATGSDTDIYFNYTVKGAGAHRFKTNAGTAEQVRITHTASADRYITLTGSNGGNPTIGTSAGNLAFAPSTGSTYTTGSSTYVGSILANTSASGSVTAYTYTDNRNEGGYPVTSCVTSINTDGSGEQAFTYTAAGSRTSDRRANSLLLNKTGAVLAVSTGGLGYGTGAGGTVTQATSRTTGVTINKPTGAITLVSAAGSASWQEFTVTNSLVAVDDVIVLNQRSGTDRYVLQVRSIAAGSFVIAFQTTGGTTTEQPIFNFAIIKGATS